MKIIYIPIGIIHSPFKEPKGTPIQPRAARDVEGMIEIFPEYEKGLIRYHEGMAKATDDIWRSEYLGK